MAPAVSVASTRKVNVPAAVGVPVMLAPLMASPGGSAPDHSDQVTAPVVPAAASAWLHAVPHDCPVGTLECTTAVAVSARPPVTLAAAPPVTGPGVADDTCAEATPVRSAYWNAAADECSWMRPLTVAPVLE